MESPNLSMGGVQTMSSQHTLCMHIVLVMISDLQILPISPWSIFQEDVQMIEHQKVTLHKLYPMVLVIQSYIKPL